MNSEDESIKCPKKKITVTIDNDLYVLAKNKYDNLSGRINDLLSIDLHRTTEKDELVEKLHNLHLEERIIEDKLCEIRKREKESKEKESNFDKFMKWAVDIQNRRHEIGLNMVKSECNRLKLDYPSIRQMLIEDPNFDVVKVM